MLRVCRVWFPTSDRLQTSRTTWSRQYHESAIVSLNLPPYHRFLYCVLSFKKKRAWQHGSKHYQRWYNGRLRQTMVDSWYCLDLTCKRGSVGQSEGLLIPRSLVRFRIKPENSNSHGPQLHRPSIKVTKLLLKVRKAIIIVIRPQGISQVSRRSEVGNYTRRTVFRWTLLSNGYFVHFLALCL